MKSLSQNEEIIQKLKASVLSMQGFKHLNHYRINNIKLGAIEKAFPQHTFPLGAVHEFISHEPVHSTATNAFISALLGKLMINSKVCLWISAKRTIYPPALRTFGVYPQRIIFIDLQKDKDVLWVVEEALKCNTLAAVVAEVKELSFVESRRLQLAVEDSHVTGFIHRYKPKSENTVACVTRWKISPLPSMQNGLPGVGYARWNVQLTKVRNGTPGQWLLEWQNNSFNHIDRETLSIPVVNLKAG